MADAGFFKGTSMDQDRRFSDKEMKLLKTMKFPPEFSTKVDMRKVNVQVMRPWIANKVVELVGLEDEVVVEYAMGLLEDQSQPMPDPKKMQINLTGFLTNKTPEFMTALWKLLIEAQGSPAGIPQSFVEEKKQEMRQAQNKDNRAFEERDRRARLDEVRDRDRSERGGGRGRGRGRGRGGRGGFHDDDRGGRARDSGWGGRGGRPGGRPRSRSLSRDRSRSRTPVARGPPRRRSPPPRSLSRTPPARMSTSRSPPPRRRSPPPRKRGYSRSRSPPPARRRMRSPSYSPPSRRRGRSPSYSPPPRRRSPPPGRRASPGRRSLRDSRSPPPRRRRVSPPPRPRSGSRSKSPEHDRRRPYSRDSRRRGSTPLKNDDDDRRTFGPNRRRRSPSEDSAPHPRRNSRRRSVSRDSRVERDKTNKRRRGSPSRSPSRSRSRDRQGSQTPPRGDRQQKPFRDDKMDLDRDGPRGELKIKGLAELERKRGREESDESMSPRSDESADMQRRESELKEKALRNKVVRTRKGSGHAS